MDFLRNTAVVLWLTSVGCLGAQELLVPDSAATDDAAIAGREAPAVASPTVTLPALPAATLFPLKLLAVSIPLQSPYRALSVGQKYEFAMIKMAGVGAWPTFALRAALDQAGLRPEKWGNGMDSLAVRVASHFGRSFVRQNILFAVRAADHEDPRYFQLLEGSPWRRTKWAVSRAFVARNDSGGWMPAYSRYVANYSVPFIAASWMPGEYHPLTGIRSGSMAFGFNAFSNVSQEFLPDLKRLLRGHPENGGHLAHWRAKIH